VVESVGSDLERGHRTTDAELVGYAAEAAVNSGNRHLWERHEERLRALKAGTLGFSELDVETHDLVYRSASWFARFAVCLRNRSAHLPGLPVDDPDAFAVLLPFAFADVGEAHP
jgi:hypothetical protein